MGTRSKMSVVVISETDVEQDTTVLQAWNNNFCCCGAKPCCYMKNYGLAPCCCPNMCCCMCCMWGSAMSQIKGKDWSYMNCCLGSTFCIFCTLCYTYKELAPHYGIQEDCVYLKPCAPIFSYIQILDTVMTREKLHMVNMGVEPDPS